MIVPSFSRTSLSFSQGTDLAEDFDIELFAFDFVVYLFDIAQHSGLILL